MMPRDVVLIGVPTNSSGTVDGVARAPAVLRQRGLVAALASRPGFTDAGDLALPAPQPGRGPSGLLAEDALITMIGRVREAVSAARRSGRFPLLVGGDCPVILGALAALQAESDRPGLLFVDGHADAWPPRVSPTGEAADGQLRPLRRLVGLHLQPRPGPGHDGASNIISYLTQAITTADRRLTNSTPDPGTLLCADRRRPRCGRPGRAPGRCPPARPHCLSTAIGGNRDCQDLDRRHPHR